MRLACQRQSWCNLHLFSTQLYFHMCYERQLACNAVVPLCLTQYICALEAPRLREIQRDLVNTCKICGHQQVNELIIEFNTRKYFVIMLNLWWLNFVFKFLIILFYFSPLLLFWLNNYFISFFFCVLANFRTTLIQLFLSLDSVQVFPHSLSVNLLSFVSLFIHCF